MSRTNILEVHINMRTRITPNTDIFFRSICWHYRWTYKATRFDTLLKRDAFTRFFQWILRSFLGQPFSRNLRATYAFQLPLSTKLCLSTKFPHQEIRWNYVFSQWYSGCSAHLANLYSKLLFSETMIFSKLS